MPVLFPKNTALTINAVVYTTAIVALCIFSSMSCFPFILFPVAVSLLRPIVAVTTHFVLQSKNKYILYFIDEYNFYVFYTKVKANLASGKSRKKIRK